MNYSRAALLLALIFSSGSAAGIEIALIPKIGHVTPVNKVQTLEDGRERVFESGTGYGLAVDFRHGLRKNRPCGISAGPEILTYKNEFGGQYSGDATSTALFGTIKVVCASSGNTRFMFGGGIGRAENEIRTPTGDAARYDWVDHMFYEASIAAEFGGPFLRAFTEVRYLTNRSGDPTDHEYDATGYGLFLGISVILR